MINLLICGKKSYQRIRNCVLEKISNTKITPVLLNCAERKPQGYKRENNPKGWIFRGH